MDEKLLYGYTGLFDTPNQIINAVEKVVEDGYTKYDVNTPYPLHGMDKAMKLSPSKLGYAALVFGLTGTLTAIAIMFWISVIDYPSVIGGKPFFAFPAFVPIIFEVTVLAASIATVITMIVVFFKFPNLSHPLHDTEYMRKVSCDKYGICIQADDKNFSRTKVETLLSSLGAKEITPIYFDERETKYSNKVFEPKFISLLILISLITSGATYIALNKLLYISPFNWMADQEKSIPQQRNTFFADGFSMRKPIEGTVARGILPYPYSNNPESAGNLLLNPVSINERNIELGKKKFNIYCSPCHGYFGEGDSRMRGQFPNPPSLHSQKVRAWSDGMIYHVLTEGQNVMPSYSSQLSREERWAIVLYIRVLQRSFNAKESDLE